MQVWAIIQKAQGVTMLYNALVEILEVCCMQRLGGVLHARFREGCCTQCKGGVSHVQGASHNVVGNVVSTLQHKALARAQPDPVQNHEDGHAPVGVLPD